MKSTFTVLTFVFAALFSNAQITIDSTDIGSIGDSLTYLSDTIVTGISASAPTGTFQTFDYTGLGVTEIGDIKFLDPLTTPAVSFFPNSNLVLSSSGGGLIYLVKTDTAIEVDGLFGDIVGQGFNSPIDLKPDLSLMKFPLNYQDNFAEEGIVDTVVEDIYTGFFDSLRLVRSMQVIGNVGAYGELQLPGLTDTVLRTYEVEVTIDSVFGQILNTWQPVSQTTETKYYYRFIAKGKDYYLLEAETDAAGVVLKAQYQSGDALVAGIVNYSHISCNGLADGKAKATVVGGVPPYTFLWDDNASSTTQEIISLPAGFYNVTVTDATSSTSTDQVEIIDPDTISISSISIIGDDGTGNGAIDIMATGGTPAFSYEWSNGSTNQNLNSLDFGVYTVTVTDNRGCTNTKTFIVDNLTSVKDIFSSNVINVFPNPSNGELNIQTNEDWSFKMFSLVGAQVEVARGSGNKKLSISNHPAGIYIIEITIEGQVYTSKIQLMK